MRSVPDANNEVGIPHRRRMETNGAQGAGPPVLGQFPDVGAHRSDHPTVSESAVESIVPSDDTPESAPDGDARQAACVSDSCKAADASTDKSSDTQIEVSYHACEEPGIKDSEESGSNFAVTAAKILAKLDSLTDSVSQNAAASAQSLVGSQSHPAEENPDRGHEPAPPNVAPNVALDSPASDAHHTTETVLGAAGGAFASVTSGAADALGSRISMGAPQGGPIENVAIDPSHPGMGGMGDLASGGVAEWASHGRDWIRCVGGIVIAGVLLGFAWQAIRPGSPGGPTASHPTIASAMHDVEPAIAEPMAPRRLRAAATEAADAESIGEPGAQHNQSAAGHEALPDALHHLTTPMSRGTDRLVNDAGDEDTTGLFGITSHKEPSVSPGAESGPSGLEVGATETATPPLDMMVSDLMPPPESQVLALGAASSAAPRSELDDSNSSNGKPGFEDLESVRSDVTVRDAEASRSQLNTMISELMPSPNSQLLPLNVASSSTQHVPPVLPQSAASMPGAPTPGPTDYHTLAESDPVFTPYPSTGLSPIHSVTRQSVASIRNPFAASQPAPQAAYPRTAFQIPFTNLSPPMESNENAAANSANGVSENSSQSTIRLNGEIQQFSR